MIGNWSKPVLYDLTRTSRRASVPQHLAQLVPESSGTYAIFRSGKFNLFDALLDIGECGPRPNSKPHGLRGRLATNVPHSASEKIARDLRSGDIVEALSVVWIETPSKDSAKELQDALITLFRLDCSKQPRYNGKREHHPHPDIFRPAYLRLKVLTGCLENQ